VSLTSYNSPLNANSEDVYPIKLKHLILQQPKIEMMNRIHKSKIRNRHRRSAQAAEISSHKNITASASLTLSKNDYNASAINCTISLSFPISLPTQFMEFWFKYIFKTML